MRLGLDQFPTMKIGLMVFPVLPWLVPPQQLIVLPLIVIPVVSTLSACAWMAELGLLAIEQASNLKLRIVKWLWSKIEILPVMLGLLPVSDSMMIGLPDEPDLPMFTSAE